MRKFGFSVAVALALSLGLAGLFAQTEIKTHFKEGATATRLRMMESDPVKALDFSIVLSDGGFLNANARTRSDVTIATQSKDLSMVAQKDGVAFPSASFNKAFSEEGKYFLAISDGSKETSYVQFEIDRTAPALAVDGAKEGDFVARDVKVSWTDTSVAKASYSLDGGKEQDLVSGTVFSKDGFYSVSIEDDLGNRDSLSFTVDKTAPTLELQGATDGSSVNNDVVISFGDNGDGAKAKYSKDGKEAEIGNGHTFADDGAYEVVVTDRAGNVATASFTIKRGIAVSVVDEQGNEFPDPSAVNRSFRISEGEQGLSVTARLDGQDIPYSKDALFSKEGSYEFAVKDSSGNSRTIAVSLDLTPPTISLEGAGEGQTVNNDVVISFGDNGDGAKAQYAKDGGEPLPIGSGESVSEEGGYAATVTDRAGNVATVSFAIDKTAPSLELLGVANGGKTGGDVVLRLPDGEEGRVVVSRDGSAIGYNPGERLSESGTYLVQVVDSAGNVGEYSFTIDFKPNTAVIVIVVIAVGGLATGGIVWFSIRHRHIKGKVK